MLYDCHIEIVDFKGSLWCTVSYTDWLADLVVASVIGRQTSGWLVRWLIDWLARWLSASLGDWMADEWLAGSLADWRTG